MKNIAKYLGLGLSVIAGCLVLARPASAEDDRHWRNLDQTHGNFFLSVSGGPVCSPTCRVRAGTQIIVWQISSPNQDQIWNATPPGTSTFKNFLPDLATGGPACLGVAAGSLANGAKLVVWPCNAAPDQTWQMIAAESFGAPFVNCFVLRNANSSQVMGVSGGNVSNGGQVIQWPLYLGAPGQTTGWHQDQFWCPA